MTNDNLFSIHGVESDTIASSVSMDCGNFGFGYTAVRRQQATSSYFHA
jgi:hypothetical protein